MSAHGTSVGTRYTTSVNLAVSRTWNLRDVRVTAPETLTVSDANSWRPDADIVWHGDPKGFRPPRSWRQA